MSHDAVINIQAPQKAPNGANGVGDGANGEDGVKGYAGANLTLTSAELVKSSASQIAVNTSQFVNIVEI